MSYSSYPKTKKEWWKLVDDHWEDLLSIMDQFLPLNAPATDPPGKTTGKILTHNALNDIFQAKKNRDGYKLLRYLNGAWGMAPDKPWIHQIPGWGVLCALCSESHCIEEENG